MCPRPITLQWRHNGRGSVLDHQLHDCLLNFLFRRRSKKTSKLRVTGLCVGIHRWPVNSPHKSRVTRKMFPFDDVIVTWPKFNDLTGRGRRISPSILCSHNGKPHRRWSVCNKNHIFVFVIARVCVFISRTSEHLMTSSWHGRNSMTWGGGYKANFLRSVVFYFFSIITTQVIYWISRLYLTGVAAAQLRWHLSNINVIQII